MLLKLSVSDLEPDVLAWINLALEYWSWIIYGKSIVNIQILSNETLEVYKHHIDGVESLLNEYMYTQKNIEILSNWIKHYKRVESHMLDMLDLLNYPELKPTIFSLGEELKGDSGELLDSFFNPEIYLALFHDTHVIDLIEYLPDVETLRSVYQDIRKEYNQVMEKYPSDIDKNPIPLFLEPRNVWNRDILKK